MKEIFKWVVIGVTALSLLVNIILIGKERKPLTGQEVALNVLVNALIIAGLIYWL